ncbi:MAG: hypothetical protein KIT84_41695 [Labilithrix sp.]|nr:hypothetical protein [Labilithrix sp.]MCW5817587.1 hypothetical protein [Labilithrix sp.]
MASRLLLSLLAACAACAAGCASSSSIRRFPLKEPMLADDDERPWRSFCSPDIHDPKKLVCTPPEYVSPFVWDGVDAMGFRPVTRFLAVDPHRESVNVNALDEVPDSSWYENRITRHALTPEEVARGPCEPDDLAPGDADESWVIDQGKNDGANPGFRVKTDTGGRYLFKVDEEGHPERATGAAAIATRIYHAAGYWTGCDRVVYARRGIFELLPGLGYSDNTGIRRPFGAEQLEAMLAGASRRGDRYRFVASKWLEGKTLGPFTYEGVRKDDPNDVVPHEDRRELRGQRVLAAWLGHFDAREQNSMTTWLTRRPEEDDAAAPGHIRHWIIDLNDCFGSEWTWDQVTRRLGFSYYFDGADVLADYVTLGIPRRSWDRVRRPPDGEIFGYYEADLFDPEAWKPGYQNPAFLRMSELDAAWMARIIARFTPAHVAALVKVGDFTEPRHAEYLRKTLLARQRKVLRRWLAIASPLADLEVLGTSLCAVDLARRSKTWESFRYGATALVGDGLDRSVPLVVDVREDGRVCVPVPSDAYTVIDLTNGVAKRPLRAHVAGKKVVGIER